MFKYCLSHWFMYPDTNVFSLDCSIFLLHHQRYLLGPQLPEASHNSGCKNPDACSRISMASVQHGLSPASPQAYLPLWYLRRSRWLDRVHERMYHYWQTILSVWCRAQYRDWKVGRFQQVFSVFSSNWTLVLTYLKTMNKSFTTPGKLYVQKKGSTIQLMFRKKQRQ